MSNRQASGSKCQPHLAPEVHLFGADFPTFAFGAIRMKQLRLFEVDRSYVGGGPRGSVSDFSYGSRRRLRETVWAVTPAVLRRRDPEAKAWISPASFVTLTYPAEFERDGRVCKVHLRAWWQRLRRRWPDAWAIWVLEQQKRGAWHFHLLVRWPTERSRRAWLDRMRWVSESWAEVVGAGEADEDHLKAGTRVDRVVTVRALGEYVAKPGTKVVVEGDDGLAREMGKRAQKASELAQGRWWGILARQSYNECASRLIADLPAATRIRLATVIQETWQEYFTRREIDIDHLPQWVSGSMARDALKRAGVSLPQLFANPISEDGEELTPADLGAAAEA